MRQITREEFASIFPVLQKAPPALLDSLLATGQFLAAPAGLKLLSEGQPCPGLVLMLSGEKRVYKEIGAGREITLYAVEPGEFCVLTAACPLANTPYPANAISLTAVEMLIVPPAELDALLATYKEMRSLIFSHISKNFADVMELLSEVMFRRLDERLLDYLLEKSEDGNLLTTHQFIANELGTAREVVSRLLKDLERRGLIRLSRNCIHLNSLAFP